VRVLAVDVGTSSVRARAYDERARFVDGTEAQARCAPVGGEIDADGLADAARAAAEKARAAAGDVETVATSCFWHSLLPLDAAGRPLRPLLTWQDVRAAPEAEELARELDPAAVHARTGCVLHPSYWPAKLLWLRRHEPELSRAAARFVSFSDYLAGKPRTSISMASGTGLLDVNRCAWDDELLEAVGVSASQLPELDADAVVLGDGAASNLGAGCDTRERAALMIGTSGAYRVLFEAAESVARDGLFLYRADGRRFVIGGALSDGGNLWAWLEKTLRLGELADVAERAPGAGGVTFLALLGGERSPGWNAGARGAISGLRFDVEPADLVQAALEGVACRFAEIADLLPGVREVVATGGALRENRGWAQIVADVLERPLAVSGVDEASARGAAVFALERLGAQPDEAPLEGVVEPRPERAQAYRELRERQRELYRFATRAG
jgi:gluconokinase